LHVSDAYVRMFSYVLDVSSPGCKAKS
jgi:hypothetical protein